MYCHIGYFLMINMYYFNFIANLTEHIVNNFVILLSDRYLNNRQYSVFRSHFVKLEYFSLIKYDNSIDSSKIINFRLILPIKLRFKTFNLDINYVLKIR